ncbi:carboxylesterase/lipase family protein [Pseudonocardia sp. TRM90224]|uniref:carboxylesterase/lipase family protein n=1 Tax=Pseudonocardia sp. TRM90224 TaxID=2812678 RepID=UPI001E495186|nr:carboxylesterase family protein [Pseudonocardia sp. TRM90224]
MPSKLRISTTAVAAFATAAALAACGTPAPQTAPDPAVVQVTGGEVRGVATDTHLRVQGIPYAAPPVGELRWRSPQPVAGWAGVRDGTTPSQPCSQASGEGVQGSEDCLYLNVDAPRGAGAGRPVMVFVHGGGFSSGQGAPYDPARVVDRGDVVVVTINYRLGALGFLAHPGFDDPAVGNFGLADQQAALRWVRENAAAFGGDPRNVTLWGESSGAFATCAQMASPAARGLFDKAILQSAPCSNAMLPLAKAHSRATTIADRLGCPDVACLRALPVERLVGMPEEQVSGAIRTGAERPWLPVTGTAALPVDPLDAFRAGTSNDVPMIHGVTSDEMRVFVAQDKRAATASYPEMLEVFFGADAERVAAGYPLDAYPSARVALATALSDEGRMLGSCTSRSFFEATREPVYAFEFTEPKPGEVAGVELGAHHGVDVPYFFDSNFPGRPKPQRTAAQEALAQQLIDRWTAFARTGIPGPDWPDVRTGGVQAVSTTGMAPVDFAAKHNCGLWDSLRASS